MTATISPTAADRRQLAQVLLDRSGLELNPRVDRDQVLALLARVLDRYDPPRNEHGALVVRSLIPHSGPRPVEEVAVQRIVRTGRAPTPRAVAGELRQAAEAARAWPARLARLRPRVDEEGPAAAAEVERLWRSRGRAPSPALLGRPNRVREPVGPLLSPGVGPVSAHWLEGS